MFAISETIVETIEPEFAQQYAIVSAVEIDQFAPLLQVGDNRAYLLKTMLPCLPFVKAWDPIEHSRR